MRQESSISERMTKDWCCSSKKEKKRREEIVIGIGSEIKDECVSVNDG